MLSNYSTIKFHVNQNLYFHVIIKIHDISSVSPYPHHFSRDSSTNNLHIYFGEILHYNFL
jgi:hypothetical protein